MTQLLTGCVGGKCQYKHSCKRYVLLSQFDEVFDTPPLNCNKRKKVVCNMFYGITHARDVVYFRRTTKPKYVKKHTK